jgi:hypothetical protein
MIISYSTNNTYQLLAKENVLFLEFNPNYALGLLVRDQNTKESSI